MRRLIALSIFALIASVQPSTALDLRGLKCGDPQLVPILEKSLQNSKVEGGRSLQSYGVAINSISKAETVHSSRNKLVCKLTIQFSSRGSQSRLRAIYTLQQFSGERLVGTLSAL
jgi:hypothetical protein